MDKTQIVQKIQSYKIIFFGLIIMEIITLFAVTYVKFEFFPNINFWWIALLILPSFITGMFVMKQMFTCPNCKEKLIDAEGFTIFAPKCEKCGVAFN